MVRKLAFGAAATFMMVGQIGSAYADTAGMASNRAALGIPTQTRIDACTAGASCVGSDQANGLRGSSGNLIVLLGALTAIGLGIWAAASHHSRPVSP